MDPKVSLSWNSHQKSICNGLSLLQQRGEFVDMTLAADGHHVKVHQMVMSLVSPFIKELIASAHCPHPVIFLNRVSYETLQAILEYAYTGEVLVPRECLYQFLEACRDLHIKGLEDDSIMASADGAMLRLTGHTEISQHGQKDQATTLTRTQHAASDTKTYDSAEMDKYKTETTEDSPMDDSHISEGALDDFEVEQVEKPREDVYAMVKEKQMASGSAVQYSLSCQGSIQIILNRYLYRLRHARKNNEKMWRCADYNKKRCPAYVITKGDIVLERGCAHSHPFHDSQILKRVRNGNVYSQYHAAESHALLTKNTALAEEEDRDPTDS